MLDRCTCWTKDRLEVADLVRSFLTPAMISPIESGVDLLAQL